MSTESTETPSERPSHRLVLALAHGFGLGYSPVASGTVGSLLGVPLAVALMWHGDLILHAAVAVLLAILAVPICDVAEKHYGTKDDGRIVADEYLTFPICLLGLPFSVPMVLMAFLTFRLMDILKPPPANQLQAIPGGAGIVIDDVLASIYSLALNHLLFRLILAGG